MKLRSEKQADGTYAVLDENDKVIEGGFKLQREAKVAIEQLQEDDEQEIEDDEDDPEAEDEDEDEDEEISAHNPHGLSAHERIAGIIRTLSKQGIKHSETSNPRQHPNTANENFAKRAKDGQNALSTKEKTS